MKTDNALLKSILIWCSKNLPNGKRINTSVQIDGYTENEILGHIDFLVKNGYINIEGKPIPEMGNRYGVYDLISLSEKGRNLFENGSQ